MRLFQLEIKRVLKTRMTWALLAASLALSVLMAYIPATYPGCIYWDENGREVEVTGLEAIRHIKELRKEIEGEVTPQTLRKAVETYQRCLSKYEAETEYELPKEAYYSEIMLYAPFYGRIREAFSNPDNGLGANLMELGPEEVESFYEKCPERLASLMSMEQKEHPNAQQKGIEMYGKVKLPFEYYYGLDNGEIDYQVLLIFLITIFCAMITAPVFSTEYQTGADDILRCTKYGRVRLAMAKICSALLICGIAFLLCGIIWIVTVNSLFGWESTKSSVQVIFSVSSLVNLNIGQLEWNILAASFLCLLAVISFTLFLSSRLKSTVSSMGLALLFCMLPLIVYMAVPGMPGEWLRCVLPGGGIGMQNSILYAATGLDFLHLGSFSIWNTYMILIAAAVEIPVFLGLAVYSYCHRSA